MNSLSPKSLKAVEADLRRHRREYGKDVRNGGVLTGVPESLEPDAETLGDDAATAVREHTYRGVTIEVGLDRIEISTERNGRGESRIATTAAELSPTLKRTGLKDHLRAVHGVNTERFVDGSQRAVQARWTGTAVHTEEEPPEDTIAAMDQGTGAKEPKPEDRPALRPADPSKMAIGGNPTP